MNNSLNGEGVSGTSGPGDLLKVSPKLYGDAARSIYETTMEATGGDKEQAADAVKTYILGMLYLGVVPELD